MRRVLVVDDEENIRLVLRTLLKKHGYDVEVADSGEAALAALEAFDPDVILTDVRMPRMGGLDLLGALKAKQHSATVIVMSAYGNVDLAIEAMKAGAYDYVSKPFKPDEIVLALRKAEERETLRRENRALKEQIQKENQFESILAKSAPMIAIFKTVSKIADYKTTVLITGESGTGKELVARAIHTQSSRKGAPFVAINCGAIPENLLESELFGHKKGAFTDANADRRGLFEEATRGTLFLDEIGELPLSLQVKLLRVVQEEHIRRLGDSKDVKVDVRIIAATHRDLTADVKAGRFREDLFYRIHVLSIHIPPCAIAARTWACSSTTSSPATTRAWAPTSAAFPTRAESSSSSTPGRATCASWRTPSSGPWCWPRATSSRSGIFRSASATRSIQCRCIWPAASCR